MTLEPVHTLLCLTMSPGTGLRRLSDFRVNTMLSIQTVLHGTISTICDIGIELELMISYRRLSTKNASCSVQDDSVCPY